MCGPVSGVNAACASVKDGSTKKLYSSLTWAVLRILRWGLIICGSLSKPNTGLDSSSVHDDDVVELCWRQAQFLDEMHLLPDRRCICRKPGKQSSARAHVPEVFMDSLGVHAPGQQGAHAGSLGVANHTLQRLEDDARQLRCGTNRRWSAHGLHKVEVALTGCLGLQRDCEMNCCGLSSQ